MGELLLSGNHTVKEHEMSGKPYSQKRGWINHSNEQLLVKAYIAQSLIGDWERITVADSKGVRPLSPIKYPMKMK